MGTKKMGSKGGGGGAQDSKSNALPRQGSVYSLTLDEVQNQLGDLGKPLTSMNLDELLKAAGMGVTDDNLTASQPVGLASTSSLQAQPNIMLNSDLSKKTVDEVWRDIQLGQRSTNPDRRVQQTQGTLGEITLEDFLVQAGVVVEPSSPSEKNDGPGISIDGLASPQHNVMNQPPHWMQYHHLQQQQQQQPPSMMPFYMPVQQPSTDTNPCLDPSYPEIQMSMSMSPIMSDTPMHTPTPRHKRVASQDVVEKTVDRRQKRMIKNRESAARSRARKQAYTHELENKISRLEEENEMLKKQKEVERLMMCTPQPEPKYQLRRTSSAPL